MSDVKIVRGLSNLNQTTTMVLEELDIMKRSLVEELKELKATTQALDKSKKPPEDWRKVSEPRESDRQPLVQSDVETMMKKLNII